MQQCKKQWLIKFVRPFGLAALFAVLFMVAQVIMSFHSHDPSSVHNGNEPAHQQMECGVCLVANMPSNSGGDIELVNTPANQVEQIIAAPNIPWHGQSTLPNQARAPPLA